MLHGVFLAFPWITVELYGFFGISALLGIIMYYWSKAILEVRNRRLAHVLDAIGVNDIE